MPGVVQARDWNAANERVETRTGKVVDTRQVQTGSAIAESSSGGPQRKWQQLAVVLCGGGGGGGGCAWSWLKEESDDLFTAKSI